MLNEHICMTCGREMGKHPPQSSYDYSERPMSFFPPLCCKGCSCGSFEAALAAGNVKELADED